MPSPKLLQELTVKHRELLRKLRTEGRPDGDVPATVFQQARDHVLLQLRAKRETIAIDPSRAFSRVRNRVTEARSNLKGLRQQQAASLRQAYAAIRERSFGTEASEARGTALGAGSDKAIIGNYGLFRSLVFLGVGGACNVFLRLLSHTTVQGAEVMERAMARPKDQPLITVSNHLAGVDDPLMLTALLPAKYVLKPEAVRWTMCATDRCFTSPLLSAFFRAAKTLPVERGAGLQQAGMRAAEQRLNAGEWVHIFPEGTRSKTGALGPIRKGIGRLVAACEVPPMVVPFVHAGIENVMPRGAVLPRVGQHLRVIIGEPVPVADLLEAAHSEAWSEAALTAAITARVSSSLHALKAQLDGVELGAEGQVALDDSLLPLIEAEVDTLEHRWGSSLRERLGLPSVSTQAQSSALAATSARDRWRNMSLPSLSDLPAVSLPSVAAPWQRWVERGQGRGYGSDEASAASRISGAAEHEEGIEESSSGRPLASSPSAAYLSESYAETVQLMRDVKLAAKVTVNQKVQGAAAYSRERMQHMRALMLSYQL